MVRWVNLATGAVVPLLEVLSIEATLCGVQCCDYSIRHRNVLIRHSPEWQPDKCSSVVVLARPALLAAEDP